MKRWNELGEETDDSFIVLDLITDSGHRTTNNSHIHTSHSLRRTNQNMSESFRRKKA